MNLGFEDGQTVVHKSDDLEATVQKLGVEVVLRLDGNLFQASKFHC